MRILRYTLFLFAIGLISCEQEFDKKKVCRNTRCAFFFFIDYKNRFIFFKLRYFEDFFGLCVRNI